MPEHSTSSIMTSLLLVYYYSSIFWPVITLL